VRLRTVYVSFACSVDSLFDIVQIE